MDIKNTDLDETECHIIVLYDLMFFTLHARSHRSQIRSDHRIKITMKFLAYHRQQYNSTTWESTVQNYNP